MEKEFSIRIKNKYDTQENWENNNPVLLKGEIAFVIKNSDIDFKIGDGQTVFRDLPLYKDTIDLTNYLKKTEATNLYAPINIIEQIYPIGSIYLSVNNTNPSVLFGFGTWSPIEDRFLLAAGPSYPAGSTGGEAEHTLTEEEIPAHDHEFDRHQLWRNETVPPSSTTDGKGYGISITSLPIYTDTTSATGAGLAHNNMPPYLSVYIWKRVA